MVLSDLLTPALGATTVPRLGSWVSGRLRSPLIQPILPTHCLSPRTRLWPRRWSGRTRAHLDPPGSRARAHLLARGLTWITVRPGRRLTWSARAHLASAEPRGRTWVRVPPALLRPLGRRLCAAAALPAGSAGGSSQLTRVPLRRRRLETPTPYFAGVLAFSGTPGGRLPLYTDGDLPGALPCSSG